jgi:ABC-2 type transport system ATP-binding protein
MMEILKLEHVSKSFGALAVIRELSFTVREHAVFGLIGKNGAGKTTTMKMILAL